jgi:fermentation-respiration switch protein FrsA (DUF1100 family)
MRTRALFVRSVVIANFVMYAAAGTPNTGRPAARTMTVNLRGKPQSVQVYDPVPGTPKRPLQALVTSGDLGWLGISGDIPGHLQDQGYRVIGLNAQKYVSSYTGSDGAHLEKNLIPSDYQAIVEAVSAGSSSPKEFVSIGVSEGAGLAVVAMGQAQASPLCRGIIALGLPMKTALGWRWTDFTSWISKREPNEPEVDSKDYLPNLKVPIVLVHSIHDEYDPIDNVRGIFALAPEPKRFHSVDASNHRFSNKTPEVLTLVSQSLEWMASMLGK